MTGSIRRRLAGLLVATLTIVVALSPTLEACTVAVISGSATADGRPLLWKNRDSIHRANRLIYFAEPGKHAFLGLVNAEDEQGDEVWAGVNGAGFCIMNSLSGNLYPAVIVDLDELEHGRFMKMALARCVTVDDFERMLKETRDDREVAANFGVIDAQGGAAFFETSKEGHERFDATDKRVAPEGYIVRTNYSFTGLPGQGLGYIRYDRASLLFHQVSARGFLPEWLLTTASRDLVNSLTGEDPLEGELPAHERDHRYVYAEDTLVRNEACSTTLFAGVGAGDDPAGTTMWVRLGHPLCSVAVPQWVASAGELPLTGGQDTPPIARFAVAWHDRVFPLDGGARPDYLDMAPVINRQGTGLLLRLMNIEQQITRATAERCAEGALTGQEAAEVQREMEDLARRLLNDAFPVTSAAAGL